MSISPLLLFLFLLSISLWQIDKKTISFVLAHEKQLYENSLRAKALAIVHSCISMLGSMSGVYKVGYFLFTIILLSSFCCSSHCGSWWHFFMQRDTASLMSSMLDPLIEQFSLILNSPVQSQNPDDWSMQMEVYTSYSLCQDWMHTSLIFSSDSYSCLILRCWNVYFSLSRTFLDCLKLKFLASIHASYFA